MSWEQAVEEVNTLIKANTSFLNTLKNIKLSEATTVDYDSKVGNDKPEWARSTEEFRALTSDELLGFTNKIVSEKTKLLNQGKAVEIESARGFRDILLSGPENDEEKSILYEAKIFLEPSQLKMAVETNAPINDVKKMVSTSIVLDALDKLAPKKEEVVEKPRYMDLKEFTDIDGPLVQLKKLAERAAAFEAAAQGLKGVSLLEGGVATAPGGGFAASINSPKESFPLPPRKS